MFPEDIPLDEDPEEPQVLSLEPAVPTLDISGGIVVFNNSEGANTEVFAYEFQENKVFCVEISLGTGLAPVQPSTVAATASVTENIDDVSEDANAEEPRVTPPAEEEEEEKEEEIVGDDGSVDGSLEGQQITRMRTQSFGEDYFLKAQKTLFSTSDVVFVRSRVLVDGRLHVVITNSSDEVMWERMLVSELVATV